MTKMIRLSAAVFVACLLGASPAMAQSLTDQVSAELAGQFGVTLDTASSDQIAAATEAVFDAAITAQLSLVGLDPATATDQQIALAVGALVSNNPSLSDGAIAAMTSAAVKSRPSAAALITGQAVAQRPAAAVAITRAAVAANPTQVNQIAAAASLAAINGGQRDLVGGIIANAVFVANSNGVGATINDVAGTVSGATGINVATLFEEATNAVIVADTDVQELIDQYEDEEDIIVDENPNQDASPA